MRAWRASRACCASRSDWAAASTAGTEGGVLHCEPSQISTGQTCSAAYLQSCPILLVGLLAGLGLPIHPNGTAPNPIQQQQQQGCRSAQRINAIPTAHLPPRCPRRSAHSQRAPPPGCARRNSLSRVEMFVCAAPYLIAMRGLHVKSRTCNPCAARAAQHCWANQNARELSEGLSPAPPAAPTAPAPPHSKRCAHPPCRPSWRPRRAAAAGTPAVPAA